MIGIRFKPITSLWWVRLICLVYPRFRHRWMTIGRTIYHPTGRDPKKYPTTVAHELVHVDQQAKLGVLLFTALYLFAPLPVGIAYFRWKFEREAYLVNIRLGAMTPVTAADVLWRGYGWPWPKGAMARWFYDHA